MNIEELKNAVQNLPDETKIFVSRSLFFAVDAFDCEKAVDISDPIVDWVYLIGSLTGVWQDYSPKWHFKVDRMFEVDSAVIKNDTDKIIKPMRVWQLMRQLEGLSDEYPIKYGAVSMFNVNAADGFLCSVDGSVQRKWMIHQSGTIENIVLVNISNIEDILPKITFEKAGCKEGEQVVVLHTNDV